MQITNNITFCDIENDNIIAYHKRTNDNHILCIVNIDPYKKQGGFVRAPLKELGLNEGDEFHVFDILTGITYTWSTEWNYVELDPWNLPVHLFRIEI